MADSESTYYEHWLVLHVILYSSSSHYNSFHFVSVMHWSSGIHSLCILANKIMQANLWDLFHNPIVIIELTDYLKTVILYK